MFYVVYGYCGPDHYTSEDGPILRVAEFKTAAEIEELHAKFNDEYGGSKDKSQITFRVFEGRELKLEPHQVVTKWRLKR